jgi:hypothetical protein
MEPQKLQSTYSTKPHTYMFTVRRMERGCKVGYEVLTAAHNLAKSTDFCGGTKCLQLQGQAEPNGCLLHIMLTLHP